MNKAKFFSTLAILTMCICCVFVYNASAEITNSIETIKSAQTNKKADSTKSNKVLAKTKRPNKKGKGWFVNKKTGKKYYYLNGKKAKGFVKIKKKTYFFDKKGVMCKGWKRIKGKYYFLHNSKGYMLKNKKINLIQLSKKGPAKITKSNKEHMQTIMRAQAIYEKITKPNMSKKQKLKKCFDFALKYVQSSRRLWSKAYPYWYVDFANDMFVYGRGNCFSYAAAFGYLANACGYKDVYIISSGGHGWCEIGGYVYDLQQHGGKQGNMYKRSYDSLSSGYNQCKRAYYVKLS